MASSPVNTVSGFHARSISLPSRPNPQILDVDETLRRLSSNVASSASSSLSNKLSMLRDLYDSVDVFLNLPRTQQLLIHNKQRSCADELLKASLCFLDVCGTAKDGLTQTKEHAQEVQSMFRRKKGDEPELVKEAEKYLASRKTSKKAIRKSLRDLKNNFSSPPLDTNSEAVVSMFRQVDEVTVKLFESLLSFISTPEASRRSNWSLVSKLMSSNSKRVSCDEEVSDLNEFQKVDSILKAFIRKNITTGEEEVQKELRKLELSIQDLQEELDSLQRRIIRTRASLLNILAN